MTTDLEKQFFDTFGIEERCSTDKHCCNWLCNSYKYPQITDRHYLELICIYLNFQTLGYLSKPSSDELKEQLLLDLIKDRDMFEHQVQKLFKGNNNDSLCKIARS